jgi:hypothetical protein
VFVSQNSGEAVLGRFEIPFGKEKAMKRSLLTTSILVLCLVALWQCRTPEKNEPASAPQSRPELSVTGAILFQPTPRDLIYVADFPVTLKGSGKPQVTKTDLLGRYRFRDIVPGKYTVCWEQVGWVGGCTPEVEVTAGDSAYPRAVQLKPSAPDRVAWGDVRLADDSSAVQIDRGFDMEQVPLVEVLDAAGRPAGSGRTNAVGKYAIGLSGAAATIRVASEAGRQEMKMLAVGGGATHMRLSNHRPVISKIEVLKGAAPASVVNPGDTLTLRSTVTDPDGDPLSYRWVVTGGTITVGADGSATWQLPAFPARLSASLLTTDGKGGLDRRKISLRVGAPQANVTFEAAGAPPSCNPLSLAHVPPPSGYSPGPPPTPPDFLTFLLTSDNSAKYYQSVDPKNLRGTLGAWWKVAGFDPSNGSGGVAQAAYLNWNDLGFGRDMHFNQVGSSVYAWVTNYGCPDNNPENANLAAKPVPADAVATVCMEYSPVEGTAQPIVKFFVYVGGVASSTITGKADLDEWGAKPVPNLCRTCHGGTSPYNGGTNVNLSANFLPFDLALLQYPGPSTTPPASDLPAYYKMNSIIATATNPRPAISQLITGWYTPLNTPPTQNNNYLPTGWQAGASVPASAAGLYQNVIVPGCRTCHYSFSSSINWDTYQSALNDNLTIQSYVCAPQPVMPHAAVTYVNFWTNAYGFATSPPTYLGQYADPNWTSFGGCTGK